MQVLSSVCAGLVLLVPCEPAEAQAPVELSLKQAITLALEHNSTIRQARQHVAAAGGLALQARAIPKPELSATWTGIPSGFSFGDAGEKEIGLSQSLEFPGKRRVRGQIGDLGVEVSQAQLERAERLVSARVRQFYYAALAPQTEVEHLESVRDLLSGFIESTLSKYQGGELPFVEVLRFKVELAKLENDIIEARRRLILRLRELSLLLGQSPETVFTLTDRLGYTPLAGSFEQLRDRALEKSRTLRITRVMSRQADRTLTLAKMDYYPDFNIGAFAYDASEAGLDGWTAELGLEIPLWGWWEQKGKIAEARARQASQLIEEETLERSLRGALASAFERVKAAEAQVKLFQSSLLIDTADALQSAITEYQFNRIDALNLLDIYRTYQSTKIEYTRALLNYQVSLADLDVAAEQPDLSRDEFDQAMIGEER